MWILAAAALAATPNPDRPSFSRSGYLIADDTLEMEVGAQWDGGRSAPTTLKYSIAGVVEPRLGLDLAGLDSGTPSLSAATKIALVKADTVGVSLYLESLIPVAIEEIWAATAAGLITWSHEGWVVQGNLGFSITEPLVTAGALQTALLGGRQLTDAFSIYVEGAFDRSGNGITRLAVDGGLGWNLTEILILDGAFGWDFANETPYAAAGLTVNFGRFQRM